MAGTWGTPIERILRGCEESTEVFNGLPCWVWQGHLNEAGYGRIWVGSTSDGSARKARNHRITYEYFRAEIPEGLVIDHLCRNRACCNPWHLEPVTIGVNTRRGIFPYRARAKIQCPRGHVYDEANTYINPTRGSRHCRRCATERIARARARART